MKVLRPSPVVGAGLNLVIIRIQLALDGVQAFLSNPKEVWENIRLGTAGLSLGSA